MSTAHWQARRLPILAAWPVRSSPAVHPCAIISAGLAPILLTGAYLMAGILQPASYSPVRTTISVMAGQAGQRAGDVASPVASNHWGTGIADKDETARF